jgi:O-antigen/teichoic acid export membrane protein
VRCSAERVAGERLEPGTTAPDVTHFDSARTIFGTAAINFAYVSLGLVVASVLARTLGPEGRGAYAAILSLPMVLAIVAGFGFPCAMLLEGSRSTKETGTAFVTAALTTLLLFVPVGVASWYILPSLLDSHDARTLASARWFLVLSVPAMVTFSLLTTAVQGTHAFRDWNWLRLGQMVAWPVLLVGAAALHRRSAHVYSLLLAASYWLMLPAALFCLAKRSPRPWRIAPRAARRMFPYALSAWAAVLPRELSRRVDLLALAAAVPPTTLGLYAVGLTISSLVGHAVGPAANVVAPLVAAASGDEHRRIFGRFGRFSVIAGLGSGVAIAAAAPLGVLVLFGRSFAPAIGPTLILILAGTLESVGRVLGDALMALGRPSRVLRAELAGLAVMGAGLWVSLPAYPLVGTALTCLASRAVILAVTAEQIRIALWMPRREFLVPTASDCRELLFRAKKLARTIAEGLSQRQRDSATRLP